jgi:hypothetical protein
VSVDNVACVFEYTVPVDEINVIPFVELGVIRLNFKYNPLLVFGVGKVIFIPLLLLIV